MASDEEYVNYNGDDSRDGYHDFTENNNTDQAAGQNHPIERRVPKRTHAGGYSSKKREVSLYDEDMYSLPTGGNANSTKESQLEDVMETLGDISNRIENQNEKPIWSIIKWLLIIIAFLGGITAGGAVVYLTIVGGNKTITGNDTSSNSNHAHSDIKPTHDTKSVTEGRDFKLFVDHGSDITYCDVKPPFTEEHLSHSTIEGMSKK